MTNTRASGEWLTPKGNWLTRNTLYPSCDAKVEMELHEYQSSDDVTLGFLIQVRNDVNATEEIAVLCSVLASRKVPRYLQPEA